jgi:broad specificity phosphatase PhoE
MPHPTVVLLVRHGEKEQGEDPALSQAGRARAQALVHAASSAGVSAIYATPYRRTQQTAQPLAQQLGLPVTVRDAGAEQARAFVRELLRTHAGQTVLVVGHSNTLPALAEALTGEPLEAVADDEYDLLLVVTLPAAGPAQRVTLRYGAPSIR